MKMQFHMRKQGNVLDDVLIGKKVTHFEHFSTVVEKKFVGLQNQDFRSLLNFLLKNYLKGCLMMFLMSSKRFEIDLRKNKSK